MTSTDVSIVWLQTTVYARPTSQPGHRRDADLSPLLETFHFRLLDHRRQQLDWIQIEVTHSCNLSRSFPQKAIYSIKSTYGKNWTRCYSIAKPVVRALCLDAKEIAFWTHATQNRRVDINQILQPFKANNCQLPSFSVVFFLNDRHS